jgi:hypothetical protein
MTSRGLRQLLSGWKSADTKLTKYLSVKASIATNRVSATARSRGVIGTLGSAVGRSAVETIRVVADASGWSKVLQVISRRRSRRSIHQLLAARRMRARQAAAKAMRLDRDVPAGVVVAAGAAQKARPLPVNGAPRGRTAVTAVHAAISAALHRPLAGPNLPRRIAILMNSMRTILTKMD